MCNIIHYLSEVLVLNDSSIIIIGVNMKLVSCPLLTSLIYFLLNDIFGSHNKCYGQAQQNLFLCTGMSTKFYGHLGGPCHTDKLTNEQYCATETTVCNVGENEATCICQPGFAPHVLRLERMYHQEGDTYGCAFCFVKPGQTCRPGQMESVFSRPGDAALLTNETAFDMRILKDEAVANNNKTTNVTTMRVLLHDLVNQLKADKAKGMIGKTSADWSCVSGHCDETGKCTDGLNPHLTYFPPGYQDPAVRAPPVTTMKSAGSLITVTRTRKLVSMYLAIDIIIRLFRLLGRYGIP